MTLQEYFDALESAVIVAKAEVVRAEAAVVAADAELAALCAGPPPEPEPPDAVN